MKTFIVVFLLTIRAFLSSATPAAEYIAGWHCSPDGGAVLIVCQETHRYGLADSAYRTDAIYYKIVLSPLVISTGGTAVGEKIYQSGREGKGKPNYIGISRNAVVTIFETDARIQIHVGQEEPVFIDGARYKSASRDGSTLLFLMGNNFLVYSIGQRQRTVIQSIKAEDLLGDNSALVTSVLRAENFLRQIDIGVLKVGDMSSHLIGRSQNGAPVGIRVPACVSILDLLRAPKYTLAVEGDGSSVFFRNELMEPIGEPKMTGFKGSIEGFFCGSNFICYKAVDDPQRFIRILSTEKDLSTRIDISLPK